MTSTQTPNDQNTTTYEPPSVEPRTVSPALSRRDRAWLAAAAVAVATAVVVIFTFVLGGAAPATERSTQNVGGRVVDAFGIDLPDTETTDFVRKVGTLLLPRGATPESVEQAMAAIAERLGPEYVGADDETIIAALVATIDPDGTITDADELLAAIGTWAKGFVVVVGSPENVDGIDVTDGFDAIVDAIESGGVAISLPFPGVPELELWQSEVVVDNANRTLTVNAEADYLGLEGDAHLTASWTTGTPDVAFVLTMDHGDLADVVPAWPADAPTLSLDGVVIAFAGGEMSWTAPSGVSYDFAAGANVYAETDLTAFDAADLLGSVGVTATTATVNGTLGYDFMSGDASVDITVTLDSDTPASWITSRRSSLRLTADAKGATVSLEDVIDTNVGGSAKQFAGSVVIDTDGDTTAVDLTYGMKGTWAQPFAIAWLDIADVTLAVSFTDAGFRSAVLGGSYDIVGKTGRVEIAIDEDGDTEATGTLSNLSLADVVAVVQDVAGVDLLPEGFDIPVDALALENVSISFSTGTTSFTMAATTVIADFRADALVGITSGPEGSVPFMAINPRGIGLGDIVPKLAGDPVVDLLTLPDATFTLTSGELEIDADELSTTARDFFAGVYGTDDFTLDLAPGLNLGGTVPAVGKGNVVGDFMQALGMDPSEPMTLNGTIPVGFLGGSGGLEDLRVAVLFPEMVPNGPSEWFVSARLGIEITGAPSVGVTGELTVDIDGDIQTFDIDAKIGRTARGVGASLTGSLGNPWVSPFDVEWLTLNDVTLHLAFDSTGSVTFGFAGDIEIGEKDIAGAMAVSVNVFTGVPTNFVFEARSEAGLAMSDIADLYAAMNGGERPDLSGLPDMAVRNFELKFAPTAMPELDVEQGFVIAGDLYVASKPGGPMQRFVGVRLEIGDQGIFGSGFLGAYELGPLAWDDARVELEISLDRQMFAISGAVELFEARQSIDLYISSTDMSFATATRIGEFDAELMVTARYDLLDPAFRVTAAMDTPFLEATQGSTGAELIDLRSAALGSLEALRDSRAYWVGIKNAALDTLDWIVPSNCGDLVLGFLVDACKEYKSAVSKIRDLDRKISSALDRIRKIPTGISIHRASFTAGFEGFQAGDVSMTLHMSAAGQTFQATIGWDFGVPFATNIDRLVGQIV